MRWTLFAALLLIPMLGACDGLKKLFSSGDAPAETGAEAPEAGTGDTAAAPPEAAPEAPSEAVDEALKAPSDVAAVPEDAEKTPSGLASKILAAGTGEKTPGASDIVTVHYSGWTTDGQLFDSSHRRGSPSSFPLDKVIEGWTEGLQLMRIGEKRRLWIPEALAYRGAPEKPAGMLVFDVELLEIKEGASAGPEAPSPIATPPKSAKKTRSGLAYVRKEKGTSKDSPGPTSKVRVHYAGWTTDGKLFDSSYRRNQPAVFALDQVIPGWTEALQLMKKGERGVVWIPEKLAYKGAAGAPQGTLVFDIQLLDILD